MTARQEVLEGTSLAGLNHFFPLEDGLGVSNVRPSTIKQKVLDHQTANQKQIRMDLLWICHFNKRSRSA